MRSPRLVRFLVLTLVLFGAFCIGQVYSASTSAQARQKWEYQVVGVPPQIGAGRKAENLKVLNTLGEDGWEAVGLNNYSLLLKRSK